MLYMLCYICYVFLEDAKGYFSYISLMCCLHMQAMLACERNNERDEGQGVKSKSKIPKKKQKVKLGRGGVQACFCLSIIWQAVIQ